MTVPKDLSMHLSILIKKVIYIPIVFKIFFYIKPCLSSDGYDPNIPFMQNIIKFNFFIKNAVEERNYMQEIPEGQLSEEILNEISSYVIGNITLLSLAQREHIQTHKITNKEEYKQNTDIVKTEQEVKKLRVLNNQVNALKKWYGLNNMVEFLKEKKSLPPSSTIDFILKDEGAYNYAIVFTKDDEDKNYVLKVLDKKTTSDNIGSDIPYYIETDKNLRLNNNFARKIVKLQEIKPYTRLPKIVTYHDGVDVGEYFVLILDKATGYMLSDYVKLALHSSDLTNNSIREIFTNIGSQLGALDKFYCSEFSVLRNENKFGKVLRFPDQNTESLIYDQQLNQVYFIDTDGGITESPERLNDNWENSQNITYALESLLDTYNDPMLQERKHLISQSFSEGYLTN